MISQRWVAVPGVLRPPNDSIGALLSAPSIGVALLDRRLRYKALNLALARMNGVPAKDHLGKTIHDILGSAADVVASRLSKVFETGNPIHNALLSAQLPGRREESHWFGCTFPLRSRSGKIVHVVAVLFEITSIKRLERAMALLTEKLSQPGATLPSHSTGRLTARGAVRLASQMKDAIRLVKESQAAATTLFDLLNAGAALAGNSRRMSEGSATCEPPAVSLSMAGPDLLSHRERQVLRLLAESKTSKQIAASLSISCRTVDTYRARIMLKINTHSLPELVRYAIRHQMIEP